jgi:multidrug efflux pump subunit AcrB
VIAVLASLVVARLLTPMMAAYLLKPHPQEEQDGWLMTRYMRVMKWCLRHRWSPPRAGLLRRLHHADRLLPTGFVPAADRAQTQINLELPPGSTLAETSVVAERARPPPWRSKASSRYSAPSAAAPAATPSRRAPRQARSAVLTMTTVHRTDARNHAGSGSRNPPQAGRHPGARFKVGPPDNVKMQLVLRSKTRGAEEAAQRPSANCAR